MALWPFRRRSGRKRPRSGAAVSDTEGGPPLSPTDIARASSKKKRRTEPPRPHHPSRTYSFEPGQQDSLRIDQDRALLRKRDRNGKEKGKEVQDDSAAVAWDRMPTLHHNTKNARKRRDRKERREREAKIKALVDFEPARPAAEQWTSGRQMKKDTQKAGNAVFGRHKSTRNSEVSLPSHGSIHSSLSSDSELGSYTVSPLDVLAPRPTLRLARSPRWSPPPPAPLQLSFQRRKLVDKEPIPEATMRAHKRIDSLADDLDAGDLRELMERDTRRREKRKLKERARMERRLAKRAEEQKAEEVESRNTGTPPPENLERGVMGRELVGLGIEPASAVITSSKHRTSSESESLPDVDGDETMEDTTKKPLEVFCHSDTITIEEQAEEQVEQQVDEQTEEKVMETPIEQKPTPMEIDTPKEGSLMTRPSEDHPPSLYSARLAGILRSVRSRSKSTLRSDRDRMVSPPPDTIHEEPTRKNSHDSNSSTKTARFSIRALFRFGSRRRRNSGPSTFSNTSREEMQAVAAAVRAKAQAQAKALARLEGEDLPVYLARKPSSGVPKRTRSRFREDLPELPISPPSSRVQSPEPEPPVPALPTFDSKETEEQARSPCSTEGLQRAPSSVERAYASPSPEAQMSVSLASIDSEGSWLSGNKDARRVAMRNSLRRANRREQGMSETPTVSTEEEAVGDENSTRPTIIRTASKKETGDILEHDSSSDEEDPIEDPDLKWGSVGTHPRFVQRATMKSQEGLLDIESENDSESSPISPVSQSSEIADFQRARSVNLGRGHVRNFSAGSAKLLEISPRLSADRRTSSERRDSNAMIV